MAPKKITRFLSLGLMFTYGCGGNLDTSKTTESNGLAALEVNYLDPQNGNSAVPITASSTFPNDPLDATSGRFSNFLDCPFTATIDYVFEMKNVGTGTLTSSSSPIVTVTQATSSFNAGHEMDFSITTPPTFPILPGGSTTFTMTLTLPSGTSCRYGEFDTATGGTKQSTQLAIQTNDPTNPNFLIDLTVFGNS